MNVFQDATDEDLQQLKGRVHKLSAEKHELEEKLEDERR